jgi:hypothetical protein
MYDPYIKTIAKIVVIVIIIKKAGGRAITLTENLAYKMPFLSTFSVLSDIESGVLDTRLKLLRFHKLGPATGS